MASFKFTLPTGQPFEIKGPENLTFEQAKAIFDQQAKTGSLVGFKPGQSLSAASQAAAGLSAATSALGQGLSGITGALGAGIPGSTDIVGSVSNGLSQVKSLAASATSTITKAISGGIPSNPINIADFTKENSALKGIGSMSLPTVTGVMAQAKKLIGQGSDILSNNKGAGGFGFDAKQLETAGILKPGMAKYVTQGASTLSNLLKSPSAFTGKDGIKSIDGLLSSGSAQSKIQQELMSGGVAGLATQGIPVGQLGAQSLAGMSLNAAKSLPDAVSFAKGLPLPASVKSFMDTNMRDGAFAANLTDVKLPAIFKAETVPVPAVDTTNRATLNAASNRILGNDKIPAPNYGPVQA